MPQEVTPKGIVALKKGTAKLVAVPVCRSCFVNETLHTHPNMPLPFDRCCIKGCENDSAYMVALTPFQFTE